MERKINILKKAVENDFEINEYDSFEDIVIDCENFLIDTEIDVIEEEVEVQKDRGRGQHVSWSDGKGMDFESTGEIVDFKKHWSDPPGTKVVHSTVVDTDANVVELYYIVGVTDYNQPLPE